MLSKDQHNGGANAQSKVPIEEIESVSLHGQFYCLAWLSQRLEPKDINTSGGEIPEHNWGGEETMSN